MSADHNKDSKESLRAAIKAVKARCMDHLVAANDNIVHAPDRDFSPNNVTENALCYVEGLKTEVQNSHTPITLDENLLTAQFANEMIEKKKQVEELLAFHQGAVNELDKEIARLNEQLCISDEAMKTLRQSQGVKVTAQHLEKARAHFQSLRNELFKVIESVFPDRFEDMKKVLAMLMRAHMSEDPDQSKYIQVTPEIQPLIETLLGINIVTLNPYDKYEVKLAY